MRSDLEVADIFRRHGHAYAQAHDGHLGRVERRVMSAIELCRTAALGGHVEACEDCAHSRVAYNSRRNRHCPKCQSAARERWLADRQADLLPVPYFHVVFTVPSEVAEIAFYKKAVVYAILFDAVWTTLMTVAADLRHLGGEIGFLAILQTWGQALTHHPHILCLVPGGALSSDGRWLGCRPNFFLPVHVLSRLFRRLSLPFRTGRSSRTSAPGSCSQQLLRSPHCVFQTLRPAPQTAAIAPMIRTGGRPPRRVSSKAIARQGLHRVEKQSTVRRLA